MTKEKRKTYSLDPARSRELVRHALDMSEQLGKSVWRQTVVDTMVGMLADKKFYNKVFSIIKRENKQ